MTVNKNLENKSRNLEQMMNELRVQSYTEGYYAGYLEACRWNDVGTGSHEGPLPVDDDTDDKTPDYPDESSEEPSGFDGGPFD